MQKGGNAAVESEEESAGGRGESGKKERAGEDGRERS